MGCMKSELLKETTRIHNLITSRLLHSPKTIIDLRHRNLTTTK